MSRKSSRARRNQRILWVLSLLVVLSMAIGLVVSFTPRPPRVTPTPFPTATAFPTRTPTPTPGTGG